jgi:hypothetical protein
MSIIGPCITWPSIGAQISPLLAQNVHKIGSKGVWDFTCTYEAKNNPKVSGILNVRTKLRTIKEACAPIPKRLKCGTID